MDHTQFWRGIDMLAERQGVSPSRLAVMAGLDPTAFNHSKRIGANNERPRWLTMESLRKVLQATGVSLEEFAQFIDSETKKVQNTVPLIGIAQAGSGGFFDDCGFPAGHGWDAIPFPQIINDENAYALEISGNSMEPVYREGDIIIIAPNSQVRPNDRVVVKTCKGEIMAKQLHHANADMLELISFNPDYPPLQLPRSQLDWMARIIWCRQ